MKYTEAKNRINLLKKCGYEKEKGHGYKKVWVRMHQGKLFQIANVVDSFTFQMGGKFPMKRFEQMLISNDDNAISALRKAVITDGLSFEKED